MQIMVPVRQRHLTKLFNQLIEECLVSLPRIHHLLQFIVATFGLQHDSRLSPSRRGGYVLKGHSNPQVETDIEFS